MLGEESETGKGCEELFELLRVLICLVLSWVEGMEVGVRVLVNWWADFWDLWVLIFGSKRVGSGERVGDFVREFKLMPENFF